ncbi:MAG: site-2 protease family protein [Gemmatimonadales bacterium]|nr:MAG: site-2 protease family protein [Gemmatimonadales bacterium]
MAHTPMDQSNPPTPPRQGERASARRRPPPQTGTLFSGVRLGSVSGFEIVLDYSWFIIFFLVLGSFAGAVFPAHLPELDRITYLWMGFASAVLLFTSLLAHELAHAFTARRRGIEIEGITLFIFGGMARTRQEPATPGDEFLIAVMGPVASFAIAIFFYGIAAQGPTLGLGEPGQAVAEYLGFLNILLAVFNLFPGFPLDGGRILRATLWKATGSLRRATRIAAGAGRLLGWMIIALGIWGLLVGGSVIGGLWLIFIGWFLGHAARASYQQVMLQKLLGPLTAREAMSPDPETVSPDLPIDQLIHDYFLRRPYNSFPVTDDGVIVGLITLSHVKGLSRDEWKGKITADLMTPLEDTLLVDPDAPMMEILEKMRLKEVRRVLVAREWELIGIISTSDIARWMERVTLVEEEAAV